ncbi:preprotein translocase subunit SecA [Natronocella acetinitrilica]|uniref:Protein translocase subunit SecA n=1 Tax=Natronocella acetinitrilica TaxID=414046 RepID=A0AAE3G4C9_9GAMM|nr:hypothetical protein [Natronocella acetinitrilica]MCP1674158.1 preprotein translocase subunit SecA [Natronocella acetinitrilica]
MLLPLIRSLLRKKTLRKLTVQARRVRSLADTHSFRDGSTARFQAMRAGEAAPDALAALACAVVAAERYHGFRLHSPQILAALCMLENNIVEMVTGEGKTVVATIAAATRAALGERVHVATANDYLAERDAREAAGVLTPLGLGVGSIIADSPGDARRAAYRMPVVYGTVQQFGFDYLRDNLAYRAEDQVSPGGERASLIVDEADAVLLDEAVTPLIISQEFDSEIDVLEGIDGLARGLRVQVVERTREEGLIGDDAVDAVAIEETKRVVMRSGAYAALERRALAEGSIISRDALYQPGNLHLVRALENAIAARSIYRVGRDYVIEDDRVVIIDPRTGRPTPDRSWSEGVHQAVEVASGAARSREAGTLARVRVMDFVGLYQRVGGMSGTAMTAAESFERVYGLPVVAVPTARPVQRADEPDRIYLGDAARLRAVCDDVSGCIARGQPVLLGAASIEASEALSRALSARGIAHNLLNANYHREESRIVAEAGRPAQVTVATAMAGRGTDILLGGSLADGDQEAHLRRREAVLAAGGLRVIGVGRHRSRRIDEQLRGRSGRQGDPGSSAFYLSLDDPLLATSLAPAVRALARQTGLTEDQHLSSGLIGGRIRALQASYARDEADSLLDPLGFERVSDQQRRAYYALRGEWLTADAALETLNTATVELIDALIDRHCPAGHLPEHWRPQALASEMQSTLRITLELPADPDDIDPQALRMQALMALSERLDAVALIQPGYTLVEPARQILLSQADNAWMGLNDAMESLKRTIPFASLSQKSPTVIFQQEAFDHFRAALNEAHVIAASIYCRYLASIVEAAQAEKEEAA